MNDRESSTYPARHPNVGLKLESVRVTGPNVWPQISLHGWEQFGRTVAVLIGIVSILCVFSLPLLSILWFTSSSCAGHRPTQTSHQPGPRPHGHLWGSQVHFPHGYPKTWQFRSCWIWIFSFWTLITRNVVIKFDPKRRLIMADATSMGGRSIFVVHQVDIHTLDIQIHPQVF